MKLWTVLMWPNFSNKHWLTFPQIQTAPYTDLSIELGIYKLGLLLDHPPAQAAAQIEFKSWIIFPFLRYKKTTQRSQLF
ncbi:uncharacterized protein LOC143031260 isoform X2 [Oratosquilla oratoria]|uniref:uncharacterized protein LOC143031260 isoform X2 n=1 Tax=Oratosquilla oratoria TaxID=337810 RepID=UPI003F772626